MLITDARDFLDEKGALAPLKGAALQLAEFHGAVISWATDYEEIGLPKPPCPRCKSEIQIVGADPNLSHRADRILSQGWKPVSS